MSIKIWLLVVGLFNVISKVLVVQIYNFTQLDYRRLNLNSLILYFTISFWTYTRYKKYKIYLTKDEKKIVSKRIKKGIITGRLISHFFFFFWILTLCLSIAQVDCLLLFFVLRSEIFLISIPGSIPRQLNCSWINLCTSIYFLHFTSSPLIKFFRHPYSSYVFLRSLSSSRFLDDLCFFCIFISFVLLISFLIFVLYNSLSWVV